MNLFYSRLRIFCRIILFFIFLIICFCCYVKGFITGFQLEEKAFVILFSNMQIPYVAEHLKTIANLSFMAAESIVSFLHWNAVGPINLSDGTIALLKELVEIKVNDSFFRIVGGGNQMYIDAVLEVIKHWLMVDRQAVIRVLWILLRLHVEFERFSAWSIKAPYKPEFITDRDIRELAKCPEIVELIEKLSNKKFPIIKMHCDSTLSQAIDKILAADYS